MLSSFRQSPPSVTSWAPTCLSNITRLRTFEPPPDVALYSLLYFFVLSACACGTELRSLHLPPLRLCRLAVFSIKSTVLSLLTTVIYNDLHPPPPPASSASSQRRAKYTATCTSRLRTRRLSTRSSPQTTQRETRAGVKMNQIVCLYLAFGSGFGGYQIVLIRLKLCVSASQRLVN